MRIQRLKFFLFALIVFSVCFAEHSRALEADQYRIWNKIDLQDSTDAVNQYLNDDLREFLRDKVNDAEDDRPCSNVAYKFMKYIRPHFFLDRLKRQLLASDNVALYPEDKNMFRAYRESIYRGPVWPFIMPVAQTIRINDVFLGTDKIDHFFSSGRRYYKVYRKALKEGMTSPEAEMEAIKYGNSGLEESGILGMLSSGAYSYADLEANYQGMRMAIDMCDEKQPVVKKDPTDGDWKIVNPLDIRRYVDPLWDEAFNNSYYLSYRRGSIEEVLTKDYCPLADNREVQALWRRYNKRLKTNLNSEYLRGMIKAGMIPNPQPQSFQSVCHFPQGVMDGPWVWRVGEIKN